MTKSIYKLQNSTPNCTNLQVGDLCPMPGKRVAVMGASGLVGQRFCQLLTNHPLFDEPDLYSWQRSGNKFLKDVLKVQPETVSPYLLEQRMRTLDVNEIMKEGYDAIFSAIPSSMEVNIELELSNRGARIFSNSGMNRMREDVPIIVPEVNDSHMEMLENRDGFIIANGNCSSIGLALPLKPLMKFGPAHVEVTTMQALSGAGYPGVASLDAVSNLVPYIESEEEKIMAEIPKIFGELDGGRIMKNSMGVDATCTRVPVREGHTESVVVRFQEKVDPGVLKDALRTFRGNPQRLGLPTAPENPLIVEESADRPQPALDLWRGKPERSRGMAVTVGRLRAKGNEARFVTLSHNTIRGAAGGSVLNAELAHSGGWI